MSNVSIRRITSSSDFTTSLHSLTDDWLQAESEFLLAVPIEFTETETEYPVLARVPGFSEKELEIVAEAGQLL
jgi:HSP20 family molecular chaperone IbpA